MTRDAAGRRGRAAFVALLALLPAVLARAQSRVIVDDEGGVVFFSESGEGVVPAVVQPGQPAGPPAPPGSRLDRLRKLVFDRRPSAILKAWSTPFPPPEPAEKAAGAATDGAPLHSGDAGERAATAAEASADPKAEAAPPAAGAAPEPAEAAPSEAHAVPAEAETEGAASAASAAKAAEAKKKASEAAEKKAAEAKALEKEMAAFQRSVTLGDWAGVKAYLAGLEKEDEAKAGYERLLQSLREGPPRAQSDGSAAAYAEKNAFVPEDVISLAAACRGEPTTAHLTSLGGILRQALDAGHVLEAFLARLRAGLEASGGAAPPLTRRQAALVLAGANELVAAGEFLPAAGEAESANDREGLNLLSRHFLARFEKEQKTEWLERAWGATQSALAAGDVGPEAKDEALKRAVEIAPRIRKEFGQTWLDESFSTRPERGREILAAIGTSASLALPAQPRDADLRLKLLELQTTAAEALLRAAPERAGEWREPLSLLASNWLKEARFSYQFDESTTRGPGLRRDAYGNFFYFDMQNARRDPRQPLAINTGKLLDVKPSDWWLALLDDSLRPQFRMTFAKLLLKIGEEPEAFPHIEALASIHPGPAKELVDEFLRVWTKNHDLNAERSRANPYVYVYGFEQRSNSIPLTRSKQERNLADLALWVGRLKSLPVELDEKLLATAFVTAHSSAEVYRLEKIEEVFGPLAKIDPGTLSELIEGMRANLASVWRDPAVQKDKKTNRKPQDIQNEVLRGYALARATVHSALRDRPDDWRLLLAAAALRHDENNFLGELKKSAEFAPNRAAALEAFRRAADRYAAAVPDLAPEKETTKAYETWFYAALGASELAALSHEQILAEAEIPLIREAILALPGPRAERHMGMFANSLFTRMGAVNPAVKFRYVRAGLAIAGDHKLAHEARKVFEYYEDLVTEIRLDARIDGSDRVGNGAPFGLFVDIRHTREIERESGGFAKYLVNQNANTAFSWNYGRPTEDYREKFEEAARAALSEHFDVLSVTFNKPESRSKSLPEYGWRVTPYAYLLLKPKGPEVDRIPPLKLDLDFLDTSGYAVIPVHSPPLPIVAADPGEARPYENLKLTRTLDERQAKDGRLVLEVKAAARGLVPALDEILKIEPEGFEIVSRDDGGASVVAFDDEAETRAVATERIFTLKLRARDGLPEPPLTFTFGEPLVETAADERFRYVDADLEAVGPVVTLGERYGEPSRAWLLWAAPIAAAAGALLFLAVRWSRRRVPAAMSRFTVPEAVSPFTVIGLLRDIERNDGLGPGDRERLAGEIGALERYYFVEEDKERGGGAAPDLVRIAEGWVRLASGRSSGARR